MKRAWFLAAALLSVAMGLGLLSAGAQLPQPEALVPVSFAPAINFPAPVNYPNDIAVGDFNNDHIQDLVVVGVHDCFAGVALGNGDGTFQPWTLQPSATVPPLVAVGDFNRDGNLDYVTTDGGNTDMTVTLGNGDGTFGRAIFVPTAQAMASAIVVADVNGDGIPDIVMGRGLSDRVLVFLGKGDGTFQPPASLLSGGLSPAALAIADVNGDGKPDLVVVNSGRGGSGSGSVAVLLGNGDGTFQTPRLSQAGVAYLPDSVAVGDFNSDGKLDVAVASFSSNQVEVLIGKGDGTFFKARAVGTVNAVESLGVADFNGDGNQDLAALSSNCGGICSQGNVYMFLGNGRGKFQAKPAVFPVGQGAVKLAISDFNADGKPDIVALNSGDGTVSVLLNTTPFPPTAKLTPR